MALDLQKKKADLRRAHMQEKQHKRRSDLPFELQRKGTGKDGTGKGGGGGGSSAPHLVLQFVNHFLAPLLDSPGRFPVGNTPLDFTPLSFRQLRSIGVPVVGDGTTHLLLRLHPVLRDTQR